MPGQQQRIFVGGFKNLDLDRSISLTTSMSPPLIS